MIPTTCNRPAWGFVCGRISVLEGRLLSTDFFQSLLALTHYDDILQHLQDSFLREYLAPGSPWEDFSALADRCFYDLAISLRQESPSSVPADLFLSQGDYLNLKNALSGFNDFPFLPGQIPLEKIKAVAAGDFADLPVAFRELGSATGIETNEISPNVSDMVVDGAYLRHLLSLLEQLDSPLIKACTQERVLTQAVSVLWRALRQGRQLKPYQQYFLPLGDYTATISQMISTANLEGWPSVIGGEIGDILAEALQWPYPGQIFRFELVAVNHFTGLMANGRLQTAGPEKVYAFLADFHDEIQNLKLVVSGRLNRIEPALLKERLREVHG